MVPRVVVTSATLYVDLSPMEQHLLRTAVAVAASIPNLLKNILNFIYDSTFNILIIIECNFKCTQLSSHRSYTQIVNFSLIYMHIIIYE